MKFVSTRDAEKIKKTVSGASAVIDGMAADGGLYVPESFPYLDKEFIDKLIGLSYPERAAEIVSLFLGELHELEEYTKAAYSKFDGDPAPLVKTDDGVFMLELWHGPTHAFKDIALTLLPYLLAGSKKLLGHKETTLVLVATSGDTGKAALEGFKDVSGTEIAVLFPTDGVSSLQRLQMVTQEGKNVGVYAIKGNFDDAQTAVKNIFADAGVNRTLEEVGVKLSSANSINFGRLVPQIVYYFSAYADLLDAGEIEYGDKINFCVPSGNFGNILAGYYAKRMGLPINRLICASNKNKVLAEFIKSGVYSLDREFYKTTSPSMDIIISSNLERLLFEICGRDGGLVKARMAELKSKGSYTLSAKELNEIKELFYGEFASEDEVSAEIYKVFDEYGYICDTHTAVAISVYEKYKAETGDASNTVIISTASPYKFAPAVLTAIGEEVSGDDAKDLKKLEEATALPLPDSLKSLPRKSKIFTDIIEKESAAEAVVEFAKKHTDRAEGK